MAVISLSILMVAVTLLSSSSARVISQNAVASILQDILSPGNTDKAVQLIKMAVSKPNKKIAIPEMVRALACGELALPARAVISNDNYQVRTIIGNDYMPARTVIADDYLPARAVIANDYAPARTVIANDYTPTRTLIPNDYTPTRTLIPNDYTPTRTVIANDYLPARAADTPIRIIANDGYARAVDMPIRIIANDGYARAVPDVATQKIRQAPMEQVVQPNLMDSLIMPKEIFQPFPVPQPQQTAVSPCQMLPPGSNPYLPVASPVSAMTPGSLPPPTQSKGQFLRKIPIPPPTL